MSWDLGPVLSYLLHTKTFRPVTDESALSPNVEVLNGLIPLICVAEGIGLLAVALILLWIFSYNDGLGLVHSQSEFNWHPFYMSLGFVYLMGNGEGRGEGTGICGAEE